MRPYKRDAAIGLADIVLRADVVEMRKRAHQQQHEWMDMFQTMPRELLLIMRNQNYARALTTELGEPVNRFRIMARSALRAVESDTAGDNPVEAEGAGTSADTAFANSTGVTVSANAVAAATLKSSAKPSLVSAASAAHELAKNQVWLCVEIPGFLFRSMLLIVSLFSV
jgi:hypothetical protein